MKYIKSFIVLIFLVGLPAGSWYFLQTGLDWRRVKAKEHVVKGPAVDENVLDPSQVNLLKGTLKGKTTLIKLNSIETEFDEDLKVQFKDAFTFQWLNEGPVTMLTNNKVINGMDYVLIDTFMNIRQTYSGHDKETMTKIVEDIALMLPHRKAKDIRMKTQKK